MTGSEIELLEVAAAERSFAIASARVEAVLAVHAWTGAAPLSLGRALGAGDAGTPTRVLLLGTAAGTLAVTVQAVVGLIRVPADAVLPLPARLRRHAPALLALTTLPTGPTLIVDPEALWPRSPVAGDPS